MVALGNELGEVLAVSIFNDPNFQAKIKAALVYAADYIEADAECLKEASTDLQGNWVDQEDCKQYELEMRKVADMSALLKLIQEDVHE